MMSPEDIIGNMTFFMFAGFDTTLNLTTNTLVRFAEDKESQRMVSKLAK